MWLLLLSRFTSFGEAARGNCRNAAKTPELELAEQPFFTVVNQEVDVRPVMYPDGTSAHLPGFKTCCVQHSLLIPTGD